MEELIIHKKTYYFKGLYFHHYYIKLRNFVVNLVNLWAFFHQAVGTRNHLEKSTRVTPI